VEAINTIAYRAESAFTAANTVIGANDPDAYHITAWIVHDPNAVPVLSGVPGYFNAEKPNELTVRTAWLDPTDFSEVGSTLAHETTHLLFQGEAGKHILNQGLDSSYHVKILSEGLAFYVDKVEYSQSQFHTDPASYVLFLRTKLNQAIVSPDLELSWYEAIKHYGKPGGNVANVVYTVQAVGCFLVTQMDGTAGHANIHQLIDFLGSYEGDGGTDALDDGYELVFHMKSGQDDKSWLTTEDTLYKEYREFWFHKSLDNVQSGSVDWFGAQGARLKLKSLNFGTR
jgi:hypothetical protein